MRTLVCFVRSKAGVKNVNISLKRLSVEDDCKVLLFGLAGYPGGLEYDVAVTTDVPYTFLRENLKGEVVFWNENILLNPGDVAKICRSLKRGIGFVSAKFIEFPQKYLVDDIYNPSQTLELEEEPGLNKIDIAFPYLVACRDNVLAYIDFSERNLFGLRLRRLGYQNYLDTEVRVGYE